MRKMFSVIYRIFQMRHVLSYGSLGVFILALIVGALNLNILLTIGLLVIAIVSLGIFLFLTGNLESGILRNKNRDPDSVRRGIIDLIRYAQDRIVIFSGKLNPILYTSDTFKAFKEVKKRNPDIDIEVIICYEDVKSEEHKALLDWLSINGSVRILDRYVGPHFIVVDDEHVRAEHSHKSYLDPEHEPDNSYREADIFYFYERFAKEYLKSFEKLKGESRIRKAA